MDWFLYDNGPRNERVKLDKPFSAHHQNIQTLCIELNKVYNNFYRTIFSDSFTRNLIDYNLRSHLNFVNP